MTPPTPTRYDRRAFLFTKEFFWVVFGLACFFGGLYALTRSGCSAPVWTSAGCEVWVYLQDDGTPTFVDSRIAVASPGSPVPVASYITQAYWTYKPSARTWPIAPMRRQLTFQTQWGSQPFNAAPTTKYETGAAEFGKRWLLTEGASWITQTTGDAGDDARDRGRPTAAIAYLNSGNPIWYGNGIRANIARVIALLGFAGFACALRGTHRAVRAKRRLLSLHCERCGYDLASVTAERCPECGFMIPD